MRGVGNVWKVLLTLLATSPAALTGCRDERPLVPTIFQFPEAAASVGFAARVVKTAHCVVTNTYQYGEPPNAADMEKLEAFGAEVGGATPSGYGFLVGVRDAGRDGLGKLLLVGRSVDVVSTLRSGRAPLVDLFDGNVMVGQLSDFEINPKPAVTDAATEPPKAGRPFNVWQFSKGDLAGNKAAEVGKTAPKLTWAQGLDESEATSILLTATRPLVAWDEAQNGAGVLRVESTMNPGDTPRSLRPDLDATWPTLVRGDSAQGPIVVLLYLAEQVETEKVEPDSGSGEPTLAEATRWVEAVLLDGHGHPLGVPIELTSRRGHVQTYAARWSKDGLVVVVRDDNKPMDGDGGKLLVTGATVDNATLRAGKISEIAHEHVAAGQPALVELADGSLRVAWLDPLSLLRTHSLALGEDVAVAELERFRPIASAQGRWLGSRLHGRGIEFVAVDCAKSAW